MRVAQLVNYEEEETSRSESQRVLVRNQAAASF